jgi:hypothetical protein
MKPVEPARESSICMTGNVLVIQESTLFQTFPGFPAK